MHLMAHETLNVLTTLRWLNISDSNPDLDSTVMGSQSADAGFVTSLPCVVG